MTTQLATIPSDTQLPAHLRTPEAAAQIAAANAAAAGGIKIGAAFPRISIETNKFSIVDGDETVLLTNPPAGPGQPALPMMCLEIVVVAWNPAVSKTYYPGKWVQGQEAVAPTCRSSNGVIPDADIADKQSVSCAACPQNQWGSKISEKTGKEIKACDDSKQLAVLPAADLTFKALGFAIKKGSLRNWGIYVKDLSERGFPIDKLVTNVTFDAEQNGVLNFSFNRFLDEVQCAKLAERQQGADVKLIVSQSRVIGAGAPQLPPPVALAALPTPAMPAPPVQNKPQGPQFPPETSTAFSVPAAAPQATPSAPPVQQAVSTQAPLTAPAIADPFHGQPSHVALAVNAAGGLGTLAGDATYTALTGKPVPPAMVVSPFDGQPPHVELAVNAAGGLGTPAGDATYRALTGSTEMPTGYPVTTPAAQPAGPLVSHPAVPDAGGAAAPTKRKRRTRAEIEADNARATGTQAPGVPLPATTAPVAPPVTAPAATPPAQQPTTTAPPTGGFGAQAPAPAGVQTPAPQQTDPAVATAAMSLRDKLMAKLGQKAA